MLKTSTLIFATLAIMASHVTHAAPAKRVALVIGNGEYQHAPVHKTANNNATAVAGTLKKLGYDVAAHSDLSKDGLRQALKAFSGDKTSSAATAVFYYAGQAVQVDGELFIQSTDSMLASVADLGKEAVALTELLGGFACKVGRIFVFLDASRANPFKSKPIPKGSISKSDLGKPCNIKHVGLAVLYATGPGQVALDGTDKFSPYTTALLKHIEAPGQNFETILKKIRKEVITVTNARQIPWSFTTLPLDAKFE